MPDPKPPTSSTATTSPAPDLSILRDQPTLHPSPNTTTTSPDGSTAASSAAGDGSPSGDETDASLDPYTPTSAAAPDPERNLVGRMSRFRSAPLDFLKEISLHVSGQGWRAYERPVGQPVFYSGFSEQMKSAVLAAPMLGARVQGLAASRVAVEEEQGLFGNGEKGGNVVATRKAARRRQIEAQLWEVLEDWVDRLICKMENKHFIRGAYYVVTQLLTRAYNQGIHVSADEVIALRKTALEAQKKGISMVFLPSHRTHIDYVSMQLICFRLGLSLPTVVAGDNLNFPVMGPFMQHAGAMWIRRSFGDDQLYSTLVQSYVDTLLKKGFNMECFIGMYQS
jgi:hypothetical protein